MKPASFAEEVEEGACEFWVGEAEGVCAPEGCWVDFGMDSATYEREIES